MARLREGYSERKRLDRGIDCTARSIFIIEKVVSNKGGLESILEADECEGYGLCDDENYNLFSITSGGQQKKPNRDGCEELWKAA